ncbi:Oligosaccharyl transferase stt3 protein [Paragonimus heterotremus]|uniref:Oligosaccharyl transferase stt3 protein n=1 Tax=Paragonimus heterotremus TaxID=100268 RepID=A0A8J4T0Q7_9TREM|nr:Oligosaccharyl transferase stt3 protein [Paragonimus heterotremus]
MNTQFEKVKKTEEKQNCLVNANLSVVQHSDNKRMKMRAKNERSSAQSYHQHTRNLVQNEYLLRTVLMYIFVYVFLLFILHYIFVISKTHSNSWIILDAEADDGHTITVDDFRETYYWIRQNTPEDARIFAWWHYGYHLNAMGKRTTFVDNHTWNSIHIALVAHAFLSNETRAYQLLSKMEADYVLIVSGCMASYPLDDVSNMQWMAQIAEEAFLKEITARNYLNGNGMISVGHEAKRSVLDSLIYKLSYFRYHEVNLGPHIPTGFDNTRSEQIGHKYTKDSLEHFEEAYTSQNWLLRLYRVLTPNNQISVYPRRRSLRKFDRRTPTVKL